MYLFHVDIFMPPKFRVPVYEGELKYSAHALEEASRDRYGKISLPTTFEASRAQLIEVEVGPDRKEILKQVWRQPLDEKRDIVLVINKGGLVRTVWVNLRADKHGTLKRTRYVQRCATFC